MKALSLFSGIGGIDLACEWAGIETVAMCEREPFCQKVLRKHWPTIPVYDDVCTLTKERLEADGIGAIELIHGGYPCQPFSLAGKREGERDDRHLWPEVFRLIQTLQPRWFVGENVAGHITLGLDLVLSDLDSIGYATETFVIPAAGVGARHRRDRVFIVAHSESEQNRWVQLGRMVPDFVASGPTQDVADTACKRCDTRRTEPTGQQRKLRIAGSGSPFSPIQDASDSDSKPESQAGTGVGSFGSKREPWDYARWSSGGYEPGVDWWSTEPSVGRVANGIPNRVDRLKALGNAVVPQQIYPILAVIKQIDDLLNAS